MFDELDTQSPLARETTLFEQFPQRLASAVGSCPGLAKHLAETPIEAITDRASLQQVPVLRKNVLMQAQQDNPPFGGFVNEDSLEGCRVFMSPGPVWEPQLVGADPWQSARALAAAGINRGDRLHNSLSYHLTPGGFILDEGAKALGCIVFPAGAGGTAVQVQAMRHLCAQVYVGTPDYLQILLDHAREEGEPISSITHALVSGGALFPAMREKYQEQGVHVQQCYATADLGVIAYETNTDGEIHAGMVVSENLIVEILIPGTDTPVTRGDVGEIVVTRLDSGYPLIRFATGDLSAELLDPSPCGRTQMRLAGWMGRADQRAKVRGMFIDPHQLQPLGKEFPELARWRVVISREDNADSMQLQVVLNPDSEAPDVNKEGLVTKLEAALKTATQLKGTAMVMETLPNDGIVIDDQRDYEAG